MLKISWRSTAFDDLAEIITYIADRNLQAARDLKSRIQASILQIAVYPYLGRPGRLSGTREIVVHPNYIVIYRITPTDIEVISVLHARREYP
ncbi:type II toxin-antitoxin system RelE/ParE family toxin [Pollutimonas thiosulfatoxidans]|uniref:Type II toxin-antitoxin system mRNA interferase toxin, RelE/StbE family n=1 Tax=Pollutimonas thiosulfatoxidans TaxID=2028345 RepID=A0A410GE04_9BURK|nr:type II toxin-antitoxin system RelE/ParE family toxin [Pollutimonas thiosulfatoxidans]MBF6617587.1 type II toxin-antitoxin system RelE/ParE family toxin [Candidimonas sp.]NYT44202.1 type II toxin-antitoxin system RelE/ParE family toxin [Alcaligenaceae bacterium]QAA94521.1 type II toxin-antitoxin system mRNA interferase toxin, RelE/StbE family [Pollutimonas thiosulfatoxidans]